MEVMRWYGDKVFVKLRSTARKNVRDAAIYVEGQTKGLMKKGGRAPGGDMESVGIRKVSQFSGMRGKRHVQSSASYWDIATGERVRKSEIEKRLRKTGTYHSKPGEPPWVQTGTLRRSITHEVHPTEPEARVGTNLSYAPPLELGSRKMAPRPFLRVALYKSMEMIKALLARKPK